MYDALDKIFGWFIVGVALSVASAQPARAQYASAPEQIPAAATEAISELWSPYCPGLMLEVCTSAGGAALRDSIEDQARVGLSADSIVEFWVARFGEEYRASPTFTGTGRVAWVTPFLALLAGLGAALLVLARRSRANGSEHYSSVTPEDEARLNEALAELDRAEAPEF